MYYRRNSKFIANAPKTNTTRDEIVKAALSLVGKVKYFWGGKSSSGWNNNWGKPKLVTTPGDRTSGTYQPYGLDCWGFTDWVYKTAGVGNMLSAGGTAYQWNKTYEVNPSEALPGDLVFMNNPGVGGANHTGIYLGKASSGKNLYVHCAGSQGVVVNSFSGFKYFRRAFVNFDEK